MKTARFGVIRPGKGEPDTTPEPVPESDVPEPLGEEHFPALEERLGYTFSNKILLGRALTHRSAAPSGKQKDYERLEFLGDAVLDLTVADLLIEHHPEAREGELSKMRAALVNTESLAKLGLDLELSNYIRLSRAELANGGAERPSILEDVMEAIFGAIYREAGFGTAYRCIKKIYGDELDEVTPSDPKTELQEALHALGSGSPTYLLEHTEGPEHAPTFVSVVEIDNEIAGRGRGNTKKASQQMAAAEALKRVQGRDEIDTLFLKRPLSKGE